MSKLKILVIPSDRYGVGRYRSINPHVRLQELYPESYFITISHDVNFDNDQELLKYDIIHLHKVPYNDFEKADANIEKIKKLGIKLIVDIDDYWTVSVKHPQYWQYVDGKRTKSILNAIRSADYVTTTTPLMATEIMRINKNVVVLPNAINPNDRQMSINKTDSNFNLRIGWLGGSAHLEDLNILNGVFGRMDQIPNTQLVLCGFDLRGIKYVMDPATKKPKPVLMEPNETDWYKYEKLFTNNYLLLKNDASYSAALQTYKQSNLDDANKVYRRIWTKSIDEYMTSYNLFDVSLAPLCENTYNKVKSQLKVIEAGFFKKAVIAQDYGPYQLDIINGKNGLLVETRKNHKDWVKKIKLLSDSPQMVTDLGEALYDTVVNKYHIDVVTKARHEFYQTIKN